MTKTKINGMKKNDNDQDKNHIRSKIAIVTGSSEGIGKAIAVAFAVSIQAL
jgi:NADP-dependent 3-hydroxy acid dehydrogenase YdfG